MTAADRQKLAKLGVTILRYDDYPTLRIKVFKKTDWVTLKKFNTKAERERYLNDLLLDSMTITD